MIYGIGRNYAKHAKELGHEAPKEKPVVFFKPHGAIVTTGAPVFLPKFSQNVHFECELAVRLDANLEVAEFTVANDLTARDEQRKAQETKSPWGLAKGFKQSCGLGPWVSARGIDLQNLELKLFLNGELKQNGFTKDMTFSVRELVSYLKENFNIEPGDIFLTGTPEGVGQVKAGDTIQAEIVGHAKTTWTYK
jgi:2-keto-4-pentenoate hydratase/2-oxohepta-3-ene-1,7-dioic acid hydratase in catechol pathway